ncbi:MAG: S26 family signal peptidase [Euryarchaeota archaeon]|nr:S26 family signal peptidase [Euryarchaeota archaeon]
MVAVESGSMEPNINTGDLVFILGLNRSNVTTLRDGAPEGYGTFARHPDAQGNVVFGDVIVFYPNGNTGCTPIIHRAVRWVGLAEPIHEAARYPALHAGYLTKGDNNPTVDQGGSFSRHCPNNLPVKPEWIVGVSRFRVPILGYFRLLFPR